MEKKKAKKDMRHAQVAEAVKSHGTECKDDKCPFHGSLRVRGRVFEGTVTKKFPKRIVIEFERMVYVRKYERYKSSRTKIHARVPECMEGRVVVGDLVRVRECRPLSKIIHFAVIEKIKGMEEK
jgi:small subunit ribosomal protein S17